MGIDRFQETRDCQNLKINALNKNVTRVLTVPKYEDSQNHQSLTKYQYTHYKVFYCYLLSVAKAK